MEAKKYTYARIAKDNALVCFVDHQTGLLSLVQDFSPEEFKNSVLALAATAELFKLPVILTTSFEQGANGPLIPDLKKMFPSAPYIPRPGQNRPAGEGRELDNVAPRQSLCAHCPPQGVPRRFPARYSRA